MKIFRLSEDELWFGETLDDAFEAAVQEMGKARAKYEADFKPRELTDEEMDRDEMMGLVSVDSKGAEKAEGFFSYRKGLEMAVRPGDKGAFYTTNGPRLRNQRWIATWT